MFAVTFRWHKPHQSSKTCSRNLDLFVRNTEFGNRKIYFSGNVFLTLGGFPPDRVSPSHVTQLLGAVDSRDVPETSDAGCNDFEDGATGSRPRIVTPPHEPFLRNRKTSLREENTLRRREGDGTASVVFDILRRELGSDLINTLEGPQTSELNERNLTSRQLDGDHLPLLKIEKHRRQGRLEIFPSLGYRHIYFLTSIQGGMVFRNPTLTY